MKQIIILLAGVFLFSACEDMFKPSQENTRSLEDMIKNPEIAEGLLGYAYGISPFQTKSDSDVATDDAVSNDIGNNYLRMATGSWSAADNNPTNQWADRFAAIQNINTFISVIDKVVWSKEEAVQLVYRDRMYGEAHAMRALNMYYLLRAHGGWAGGQLLGFPLLTEIADIVSTDFNVPRDTYQACVDQINEDLNIGVEYMPWTYTDLTSDDQVPARYSGFVGKDEFNYSGYNRAAGYKFLGRIDGRTCEAIRAQVALMAASPAFSEGTTVEWADAANAAAKLLSTITGVSGMSPTGYRWYEDRSNIRQGYVPQELLWTGDATAGTEGWNMGLDQEVNNFPPSLSGRGRINPSQNLVDAFPMANGYPITDNASGYSESNPYAGRDPRLSEYIIYNGTRYKNSDIITGTYNTSNNDGLNKDASVSTRTGYYMRKLMREDCNVNPASGQLHYPFRIRFTEIFLIYAEAANEAWGPTGTSTHGYSAYDVIKALRARAGVGMENGDAYLESVKNDKDKMRELIHNERRIELCFENKRFWDLRRLNLPLNVTVRGMRVDRNADQSLTYTKFDVENRAYQEYQRYCPIPNSEVLKFSNLQQNDSW